MGTLRTSVSIFFVLILMSGCAKLPYTYAPEQANPDCVKLREGEEQIVKGKPNAFIDTVGHLQPFSLLSKLVLWNWKVNNHDISKGTQWALAKYLKDNHLADVKVRLNQYSPGAEWSRLFRNKQISPLLRYTLGILSVSFYTIFPERVFAGLFGGDHFNPYTNTINIYSDHPAIVLHEGGHAKDLAIREYKSWYTLSYIVPFVPLYHEAQATGDALGYMKANELAKTEKNAYKILYPAYGTYLAGTSNWFIPDPLIRYTIYAAVVIPAHIVGRIKASNVEIPKEHVEDELEQRVLQEPVPDTDQLE